MNSLLHLKGINVNSKNKIRLRDVNIKIQSGERIALVGASGAGKSTLLSVANGSLTADQGDVYFMGQNLTLLKPRQKSRIGTLWQDLRLIDELNVIQNVNIGALARKSLLWSIKNLLGSIDRNQCLECLRAAGISSDLELIRTKDLSGGQRQRVAVARLLRQQAELVLADEPLTGLDPKLCHEILDLLLNKNVSKAIEVPNTMIISLHRPELINRFDRVIGIARGEIVLDCQTKGLSPSKVEWIYNVE